MQLGDTVSSFADQTTTTTTTTTTTSKSNTTRYVALDPNSFYPTADLPSIFKDIKAL